MSAFSTITFRDVPASAALCAEIERHAQALQRCTPRVLDCAVTVQREAQRHRKGDRYRVDVHVDVPGSRFDSGRPADEGRAHEDPYVAARDSFEATRRQLEAFERMRRARERQELPPAAAAP